MTRKAFIHIGTHKTGTTYLQFWMHKNSKALRKLGLLYPPIGFKTDNPKHAHLNAALYRASDAQETSSVWNTLSDIMEKRSEDIILSSESFSEQLRRGAVAEQIADFFEARDTKPIFVIFLRDVPAYLASLYAQTAKNLRTTEAFYPYVMAHLDAHAFDYKRKIAPFEARADIRVLPYVPGGPPLEDVLLSALDRTAGDIGRLRKIPVALKNPSFGAPALLLARDVAAALPKDLSADDVIWKRAVFKRLCRRHGLNATRFVGCDAATADQLRHHFADRTEAIAARYFDAPWQAVIPPEPQFDTFDPAIQDIPPPPALAARITDAVLAAKRTPWSRANRAVKRAYRRIMT